MNETLLTIILGIGVVGIISGVGWLAWKYLKPLFVNEVKATKEVLTKNKPCPEDADNTQNEERCQETRKGYNCTRKKGHEGKHHAHSITKECLLIWEDDK